MSWSVGVNGKFFLKLNSEMGLHHVVLTIPKFAPGKLTLTLFEMQKLQGTQKTDPREIFFCQKRTTYNCSK